MYKTRVRFSLLTWPGITYRNNCIVLSPPRRGLYPQPVATSAHKHMHHKIQIISQWTGNELNHTIGLRWVPIYSSPHKSFLRLIQTKTTWQQNHTTWACFKQRCCRKFSCWPLLLETCFVAFTCSCISNKFLGTVMVNLNTGEKQTLMLL